MSSGPDPTTDSLCRKMAVHFKKYIFYLYCLFHIYFTSFCFLRADCEEGREYKNLFYIITHQKHLFNVTSIKILILGIPRRRWFAGNWLGFVLYDRLIKKLT